MTLFDDLYATVAVLDVPAPVLSRPRERFCLDCGRPVAMKFNGHRAKRCAACALAATPRASLFKPFQGFIPIDCWCERTSVWVHWEDFQAGLTGTCGLRKCRKPRT